MKHKHTQVDLFSMQYTCFDKQFWPRTQIADTILTWQSADWDERPQFREKWRNLVQIDQFEIQKKNSYFREKLVQSCPQS